MNNKIDPNWFKQKKDNESQSHKHGYLLAKKSHFSRSPQLVSCFLVYLTYALYFWINTEYKWSSDNDSEWRIEVIFTSIYFILVAPLVAYLFLKNRDNLKRSLKIFSIWILLFIYFKYASGSFGHTSFRFLGRDWFIAFFVGASLFYYISMSLEFINVANVQQVRVSKNIYWLYPIFNLAVVSLITEEFNNDIFSDLPYFIIAGLTIPIATYLFYKFQKDRFLYKWTLIAWSFACLLGAYYRNLFFNDLHFGYFAIALFIPLFIYIIRVDAKKFS